MAGSATTPAGWNFSFNGTNQLTFTGNLSLVTASVQFTYKAVVDGATVPILTDLTK